MEPTYETRIGVTGLESVGGVARLELQGRIDAFVATDLAHASRQLLAHDRDVEVSCEHVENVDLSALQILVALRSGLQGRGKRLRLVSTSAQVTQAVHLAGLANILPLADVRDEAPE